MFCTQCGENVEADDKFCWNCGAANTKKRPDSLAAKTSAAAGETLNVSSTVDMQRRVTHTSSPAQSSPAEASRPAEMQPVTPAPQPQLAFDRASSRSQVEPQRVAPKPPGDSARSSVVELPAAAQPSIAPPPAAKSPWLDNVVQSSAAAQAAAAPKAAPARASQPKPQQEVLYDSVGNEITADDSSPMSLGVADIPTPSFGGYAGPVTTQQAPVASAKPPAKPPVGVADKPVQSAVVPVRKRKPVLEIIVAAFLLIGAGVAVWILHASLPAKSTAPASTSAISVALSPASADVTAGRAADFAATITGTDDDRVTWAVQEGDDGGRVVTHGTKTVDGQVSSTAVYIAPNKPGVYHLIVASVADPQKSASAEINVIKR